MKKYLFLTLFACLTVCFSSCKKEKSLPGTSWETTYTTSMEYMGMNIEASADIVAKFVDETKGDLTINVSAMLGGSSFALPTANDSFTYTFDGTNGTMTSSGELAGMLGTLAGGESTSSSTDMEAIPFTYDSKENTITVSYDYTDEETGQNGNITLTFTEIKK